MSSSMDIESMLGQFLKEKVPIVQQNQSIYRVRDGTIFPNTQMGQSVSNNWSNITQKAQQKVDLLDGDKRTLANTIMRGLNETRKLIKQPLTQSEASSKVQSIGMTNITGDAIRNALDKNIKVANFDYIAKAIVNNNLAAAIDRNGTFYTTFKNPKTGFFSPYSKAVVKKNVFKDVEYKDLPKQQQQAYQFLNSYKRFMGVCKSLRMGIDQETKIAKATLKAKLYQEVPELKYAQFVKSLANNDKYKGIPLNQYLAQRKINQEEALTKLKTRFEKKTEKFTTAFGAFLPY